MRVGAGARPSLRELAPDVLGLIPAHLPPADRLAFALAGVACHRACLAAGPAVYPPPAGEAHPRELFTRVAQARWALAPCKEGGLGLPLEDACVLAGEAGSVAVLECLVDGLGLPLARGVALGAAAQGQVAVVGWYVGRSDDWGGDVSAAAAAAGSVEVLRELHRLDAFRDSDTCLEAAAGGHVEALRWAWDVGCQMSASVCAAAARNGHLEALKMARQCGCPWGRETVLAAASRGHMHVLIWLIDQEPPCPMDDQDSTLAATLSEVLNLVYRLNGRNRLNGPQLLSLNLMVCTRYPVRLTISSRGVDVDMED